MVIMDALGKEYKEFDEDALPADTREHIRVGLVKRTLCTAIYVMST